VQKSHSFQADVLMMLASKAIAVLTAGVASVLIARDLGPAGRGAVAVAANFITLFAFFGNVGLISANSYFVARDPRTRGDVVANSICLSLLLGLALVGIELALKAVIPQLFRGLNTAELVLIAIGIPAALGAQLLRSILLGEGRTVAYNATDVVLGLAYLAALLVGLKVYSFGTLGVIAAVAGNQVGACVLVLILVLIRGAPRRVDLALASQMMKYAGRAYLAALAAYVVIRVDLLLVNAFLGSRWAGQYGVAVNFADMLYVFPAIMALNLFPRIARGASYLATALVFRVVAVSYGVMCLLAAALAEPVIHVLYGPAYAPAAPLFVLLIPGLFGLGLLNLLAQHFAGSGFPVRAVIIWLPGVLLVVGLDVGLLPVYGAYVASVASSLAYTLILVLHMRMFAEEAGGVGLLRPRVRETATVIRDLYRAWRRGTIGASGEAA
jgi:antigen flippase